MGKKRRVWWIAGSFLILLIAFATVGLTVVPPSERLQREVRSVVRDYGFVEVGTMMPAGYWIGKFPEYESYEAEGLNKSDLEQIVARFDSASGFAGHRESRDARSAPTYWTIESESTDLTVVAYPLSEVGSLRIDVNMYKKFESSPWDRIRSWWPW